MSVEYARLLESGLRAVIVMRTEVEILKKIVEMRAQSPDWFLSLTSLDMVPELKEKVTEHLPYIQAGMLIGLAWTLGYEDKDLVSMLFSKDNLPEGLKLEDFDINS